MQEIDIFVQGKGHRDVEHLRGVTGQPVSDLKGRAAALVGLKAVPDLMVFAEDAFEPLAETTAVEALVGPHGAKIHLHTCHQILVSVTFNNRTVDRRFGPGATVARVKRWAAQRKFDMSKEDAGEHLLQISGTQDRPAPSAHIGTLVTADTCSLAFDLVPDERVQGAPAGQG